MDYVHLLVFALVIVAFSALLYVLWLNGYLIISRKTAALFLGLLRRKGRCKVKFASCNGYVKKVIKIDESRNYTFNFNGNISKGNVIAEIQDKSKNILLQLDKNNSESAIDLDKDSRYYLVLRFEKADGNFELTWN